MIPATDGRGTLSACLAAIDAADDPPQEVVVVREPAGSNPAAARNEGAGTTTADVVVFVDSDVLVHVDTFTRIRAAFAGTPGLVAVFGSYDDTVATDDLVAAFRNLLHHTIHQRSAGEVHSFWAGLGAVRRSAFEQTGGFDAERYGAPSIEDIELGGRLAAIGRIELDPELQGTHLKEWTLTSMVRTDLHRRGIPWVELMVERRQTPAHLNLGARERASALAAILIAFGIVRRRAVLTAAAVGAEVALNHDLFSLLRTRIGLRGAAGGVVLHTLHQLTAVVAVPAGLARAARRQRQATVESA